MTRIADPFVLHPAAAETWAYIDENVLHGAGVDQRIKQLCFRYVAEDGEVTDLERFDGRERTALEWAHAIVWDADRADDDLWRRLHEHFSEVELVELGCAIGFELGRQHFLRTLGN